MRVQGNAEQIISWVGTGIERLEACYRSSPVCPLVLKVHTLIESNRALFFWGSNAIFLSLAPKYFLVGASSGVVAAVFGSKGCIPLIVKPIAGSKAKNIAQVVSFVMMQCLHEVLQTFIYGCIAGYQLFQILSGEKYGRCAHWFEPLQYELDEAACQLAQWIPFTGESLSPRLPIMKPSG